jgi:hypothetical protein
MCQDHEISNVLFIGFVDLLFPFLFFFFFLMCNLITYTLQMEGVPGKARNLQMHLLMGKLYRNARHTRPAIACYKECLRFDKLYLFTPTSLHFIL